MSDCPNRDLLKAVCYKILCPYMSCQECHDKIYGSDDHQDHNGDYCPCNYTENQERIEENTLYEFSKEVINIVESLDDEKFKDISIEELIELIC